MKKNLISYLLLIIISAPAYSQYSVCGNVVMENMKYKRALVTILESKDSVLTDTGGDFCFAGLAAGEYTVKASIGEMASPAIRLLVNDNVSGIHLVILPTSLDTVSVTALNRAQLRAVQSIKTGVIDLSSQARSSASVEQMINRSGGIRIRNTGGLGAEADIVVGGFNGKSVKFLIDGIPVDYLGTSMGITKIPAEAADYIEVYKGVMPPQIGIDALGSAINIVTRKPAQSAYRASYETGSFNTHRFTLNAFVKRSENLSYGFNTFLNYSDNNFEVDNLPVADAATGRTRFITARLFHNAYKQYSTEAFVNLENRKWADQFKIKINSYALRRDIQNDFASRSRPFGKVYTDEKAPVIPSVEYNKSILNGRLQLSQFVVYSSIGSQLADTLKNRRYDWSGHSYDVVSGSEMGRDLSNLAKPIIETRLNNFTYRGLFTYSIKNGQKLILNVVENNFHRTTDDLNKYHTKTHIRYNRLIAGLGYQYRLFKNKIEGLTQVKYLNSTTKGELYNELTDRTEDPVQNSGVSVAQSLKYTSYSGWLVRTSVENTYRLPDQMEIFGDNVFIIPNVGLKPERSTNLNLGTRYKPGDNYSMEVNTYFRFVKDLIRLKDVTQFTSVFLNLDKVNGYGVELEGMYRPVKNLELTGNLTYNEFRFKGSNNNVSDNEHFINARVSNMPFYFGNAMASYTFNPFLTKKDRVYFYWSYTYVHQYYLDYIEKQYEPDGFLGLFGKSQIYTGRIIPVQQIHSGGFVWTMELKNKNSISFSSELENIFDKPVFNTFKMQSAGRSISAKISYEF